MGGGRNSVSYGKYVTPNIVLLLHLIGWKQKEVGGKWAKSFKVGFQNVVCGCILGWQCAAFHFGVTVSLLTMTSDLVSRIIEFWAYLYIFCSPEPKAPGELIGWDSSLRLSVHAFTLSNMNIPETSWPITIKGPRTVSYSICPNFDSLLIE